jgi:hypothetical protein
MGGATNLIRVSIDPEKSGFSGEPEIWPALAKLSEAPICLVLSFTIE